MDLLRRRDFSGVKRTWLHCWYGLVDAYAQTLGLDYGLGYVSLSEFEMLGKRSLLRYRLSNFRKLCVQEFLGLNFKEYLASPRATIAEYDAMCTEWSSDPEEAAKAAAAKLRTTLI